MKVDDAPFEEELWARQKSDTDFEVCCIPFFIYDVHWATPFASCRTKGRTSSSAFRSLGASTLSRLVKAMSRFARAST
jgi:hypothetical protein